MSSQSLFKTVPTELLEVIEAAHSYFRSHGYTVQVEPQGKPHFPNTPPMLCKRDHTQVAVLAFRRLDTDLLDSWVATAKNIRTDFRVAVCVPPKPATRDMKDRELCRKMRVGVYECSASGVTVLHEPLDQGMQIALPDLARKPRGVRQALGAAVEHLEAGRWREGFDEACKSLEQRARPYLEKAVRSTRLTITDNRGRPIPADRISKMTLGQLAHAFDSAPTRNQTDELICRALKAINPDRVKAIHKNRKAGTETKLRSNVGIHLLTIINALEAMYR